MEHLPKALRTSHRDVASLKFPCRCDPDLSIDAPLEEYPERRGFRLNRWGDLGFSNHLTLPDGSKPTVVQCTSLLQEWLFFGYLRVVTTIYGHTFRSSDYIDETDDGRFLTLRNLPGQVQEWYETQEGMGKQDRKRIFHAVEEHSMRTLLFLTNNFTSYNIGGIKSLGAKYVITDDSRIALESSLEVLLMCLVEAMAIATRRIYFREKRDWTTGIDVCFSTRRLLDLLQWCPSELHIIDQEFDNSSYVFARGLDRGKRAVQHSECDTTHCIAFQLEESTYETAHTSGCRNCIPVRVDQRDLNRILEDNRQQLNPRFKISIGEENDIHLSVTTEGDYVAISHVWSDGLGHPPAVNSLPTCQLRRLRSLILQTGMEEPVIWVDSLCVPAIQGIAKWNALARMAKVYREAKNVLVLDSDLLSVPSTCSNEELLLRIALSKWMRRLWTLEEGVLARERLLFQCTDRSIPLPLPRFSSTDCIAFNCARSISRYLPTDPSILAVVSAVHFRSTSWKADEPLCIGYILDIDVSSIVPIQSNQDRMLELYGLLSRKEPNFPWQFLFSDEEKLGVFPFSWAPLSFLELRPYDLPYLQGGDDRGVTAVQTDRGLQFRCTHLSCLLSFDEGANINKCMLIRIGSLSFVLCPVPKGGRCRSAGRFWKGSDRERCISAEPAHEWTESWRANYNFRPSGHWGLIYPTGGGYGVLVAVNEAKDKVLYATLVGQVHMFEIQNTHSTMVSNLNQEYWGQLGLPALDEEAVRLEQDRVEREVFDEQYFSRVKCVKRFDNDVVWCVG